MILKVSSNLDDSVIVPPFNAKLPRAEEEEVSVLKSCQTDGKFLWMYYTVIHPKNQSYTPQGEHAAYFGEGTNGIMLNMD